MVCTWAARRPITVSGARVYASETLRPENYFALQLGSKEAKHGGISAANKDVGCVRVVFEPSISYDLAVRVPSGATRSVKISENTTIGCARSPSNEPTLAATMDPCPKARNGA